MEFLLMKKTLSSLLGGRLGNQLISYTFFRFGKNIKTNLILLTLAFDVWSLATFRKAQRYCFHSTSNSGHILFWILFKIYLLTPRFLKHSIYLF